MGEGIRLHRNGGTCLCRGVCKEYDYIGVCVGWECVYVGVWMGGSVYVGIHMCMQVEARDQ